MPRPKRKLLRAALLVGWMVGCSASPTSPTILDASPVADAEPAPLTCDRGEEIPLNVSMDGTFKALEVRVERPAGTAALGLDTGSPLSFLYSDRSREALTFGCTAMTLEPRAGVVSSKGLTKLPKLGLLGADFVLERPTLIDPVSERLLRYRDPSAMPDTTTWRIAKIEVVESQMIATAIVDGVSLDLLVDTGASDLLWLGEPGRDSDAVHRFLDAQGTLLDAFRGVSKISFAGGPARDLPVDRIPTWPYLEAKLAYLDKFRVGKKIRGLLGLSVLGAGQVLIDGHGGELRLEVQR